MGNKRFDIAGMVADIQEKQHIGAAVAPATAEKGQGGGEPFDPRTPSAPVEPEMDDTAQVRRGRPRVQRRIDRPKMVGVGLDVELHRQLGMVKLEEGIDMKDLIYLVTRDFMQRNFTDGHLSAKAVAYLQNKLSEVNG